MSKMSEIYLDIQTMLEQGRDITVIAKTLQVPVDWVCVVQANLDNEAVEDDPECSYTSFDIEV